jgi:hypothetical protein
MNIEHRGMLYVLGAVVIRASGKPHPRYTRGAMLRSAKSVKLWRSVQH